MRREEVLKRKENMERESWKVRGNVVRKVGEDGGNGIRKSRRNEK